MNNILYRESGNEKPEYGMILIHGRGADAHDIISIYEEIDDNNFLAAAPQAPGNTWYPYSFMAPVEANEPFLTNSLNTIDGLVKEFIHRGIDEDKLLIIGFSQGACLALEYIFRNPLKYFGVAALSGALISSEISGNSDLQKTSVFLGCSEDDPHIPRERVDLTEQMLNDINADTRKKIYKGNSHGVNQDEILEIRKIIEKMKKT